MPICLVRHTQATVRSHGRVTRRDFVRGLSAASVTAGTMAFSDAVSLHAENLRKQGRACIVLWMGGGPSQFETFSPLAKHANGGEMKSIATSVPGVHIAANFPQLAKLAHEIAIIRSMTSKEGNHNRASFLLHSGNLPTPTVKYPSLGAVAAHEIADKSCELPSYVRIGRGGSADGGGGFLGVQYDPFVLLRGDRAPENASPQVSVARFHGRQQLLARLEAGHSPHAHWPGVADHQKLYQSATKMILSSQMAAFDLQREPQAMRTAYGEGPFASGCLLARRLVEQGVTFVEVALGGWDTHIDNFSKTKQLADQLDRPMAQLISDLKQRGMLERTLVVWMGEFGRTPKINPRGGRDHYPRAFNVVLAGGGIQGGRVIGKVTPDGAAVDERPVTVSDLFRSIYHSLQIDPDREQMTPIGRPVKLVEGGALVQELFA